MTNAPGIPDDAEQADADYEKEVEAEHTGRTADDVEQDRREDERDPLDEAYQPRSG